MNENENENPKESDPIYNNSENKERSELHESVRVAASYLERLDNYAEHVVVDENNGKIKFDKPELDPIKDDRVSEYQKNFTELLKKFRSLNKQTADKIKSLEGVLDVKRVMGAVIVTLDSSKQEVPTWLLGDDDNVRGMYHGTEKNPRESHLGLIVVDINKQKRKDGVDPTTSAAHELHHHSLSMSDYLMSKDHALNMSSSFRKGRSAALFGEHSGRMTTDQAFWSDADIYEQLADRPITTQADQKQIEHQLRYLDELHSSYLQKKQDWFSAKEDVYTTRKKGKHWEVVGDHPEDVRATKKLLGYMQGMHSLDQISNMWIEKKKSGTEYGPVQEKFMSEFQKRFLRMGSLIGAARTVKQATEFAQTEWYKIQKEYPKLLKTPVFLSMLDQWESLKSGVDGLRDLLT